VVGVALRVQTILYTIRSLPIQWVVGVAPRVPTILYTIRSLSYSEWWVWL